MDEGHFSKDFCIICKKHFEDGRPVVVSTKVRYSEKHGRLELADYLTDTLNKTPLSLFL